MKNMIIKVVFLLFFLSAWTTYGEFTDMEIDEARAIYKERRLNAVSKALRQANSIDDWPSDMDPINQLMTNETPDSARFRLGVCSEIYNCAKDIEGVTEKKKELVWLLTTRLNDKASIIRGGVLGWLRNFSSECFNDGAKQNVRDYFDTNVNIKTILLMGVVDQAYCLKKTTSLVEQPDLFRPSSRNFWGRPEWAALLVHARSGDSGSIEIVLDALEHEPNERLRASVLFRNLGYTLHPKAVEYLKTQVIEDRTIAGGNDYPSMSYAQEACLVLSTMLKNFPEKAGRMYTAAEMERCKAWLSKKDKWVFVE